MSTPNAARYLFIAVFLIGSLGNTWERFLKNQYPNALHALAIITLLGAAYCSSRLSASNRARFDRIIANHVLFTAICMALLPGLLEPFPGLEIFYRSTKRWRGWCVDPNNAAMILALGLVSCMDLVIRVSKRARFLLLCVVPVLCLQLARTYSRIGILVVLVGAAPLLSRYTQKVSAARKFIFLSVLLATLACFANSRESLQHSNFLPLRRVSSFLNQNDLSWLNRVYVIPGMLRMATQRPILGWNAESYLPFHRAWFSPTFLPDNTAALLNDYTLIAVVWGIPIFITLGLLMIWVYGRTQHSFSRTTASCIACAMFFQGVLANAIVLLPFCFVIGILIGEASKAHGFQKPNTVPFGRASAALFLALYWLLLPVINDKHVIINGDSVAIFARKQCTTTIVFVCEDPVTLGREARAAASYGVRAIIAKPGALERIHASYPEAWYAGMPTAIAADRYLGPLQGATANKRGCGTVRDAYAHGAVVEEPTPDRPLSPELVVSGLFWTTFLVIAVYALSCVAPSKGRCRLRMTATLAIPGLSVLLATLYPLKNSDTMAAKKALLMTQQPVPQNIYIEYIENNTVHGDFAVKLRDDVWHTLFQTTKDPDPLRVVTKLSDALEVQMIVNPVEVPTSTTFESIWASGKCSSSQRPLVVVAILRALGIAARLEGTTLEIWRQGKWVALTDFREI